MTRRHVATAEIDIAAPADAVWAVLSDTEALGEVMFGSEVVTDWTIGGPIVYRGEWEGKAFEDRGEVLELDPPSTMRLSHYEPSSADPDDPETHHEVRYDLRALGPATHVTLTQDNNASAEAADHAAGNWAAMLASLKKVVESR